MNYKSKTDPKARSTATDTPAPAGQKPDTQLSDAALDKVVGGASTSGYIKANGRVRLT